MSDRHDFERCDDDIDIPDPTQSPNPHRDASVLRHLYWERGLTQKEVAEVLDVSSTTVTRWMRRHDIGTRIGHGTVTWDEDPRDGENTIRSYYNHRSTGDRRVVGLHQMLALTEYEPEEVFGDGQENHHRLPTYVALNVRDNIVSLSAAEHGQINHPGDETTPEEADTATTLAEIGWEQSGVPLDAIRGLHGSTVPVGDIAHTEDDDDRTPVATDGGSEEADE